MELEGEGGKVSAERQWRYRGDFSYMDLGGSIGKITSALTIPKGVEFLNFWDCNLGDQGLKYLCKLLKSSSESSAEIHSIDLWGNGLSDSTCKTLANFLEHNESVEELRLWNNQIGDSGATILAAALKKNSRLLCLSLWRNKIGTIGADALLEALKENKKLRSLDLGRCIASKKILEQLDTITAERGDSIVGTISVCNEEFQDLSFAEGEGWGDRKLCPPASPPLAAAVGRGDVKHIAKLLQDIETSHSLNDLISDRSCLHWCSEFGHAKVSRLLLDAKAEVDITTSSGKTPLHIAARNGHEEVIRTLIERRANILREDRFRRTPLDVAKESVRQYLSKGADKAKNAQSAFFTACKRCDAKTAKELLERNVWINAKSKDGTTGLMISAQKGHMEIAQMLLEARAKCNVKEIDGWAALHFASREGHKALVELLLDANADAELQDKDHFTALHAAAEVGHVDVVRTLLKANAKVTTSETEGRTALHIASDNGSEGGPVLVKMLIEYKADIASCDNGGKTPLHWAAPFSHSAVIELLLEADADVEARDRRGWRPLHFAVSEGNLEAAETLLEHKSNVLATTADGKSCLHLAAIGGYDEVLMLLLEQGADVTVKDFDGITPLHCACRGGYDEAVQQLLGARGDPLCQDKRGRTALHAAALGGNEFCVEILLDNGAMAAAGILDTDDKTPHQLALESENEEIGIIFEDRNATGELENGTRKHAVEYMESHVTRQPSILGIVDEHPTESRLQDEYASFGDTKSPFVSIPDGNPPDEPNPACILQAPDPSEDQHEELDPQQSVIVVPGTTGVGSLSFAMLGASDSEHILASNSSSSCASSPESNKGNSRRSSKVDADSSHVSEQSRPVVAIPEIVVPGTSAINKFSFTVLGNATSGPQNAIESNVNEEVAADASIDTAGKSCKQVHELRDEVGRGNSALSIAETPDMVKKFLASNMTGEIDLKSTLPPLLKSNGVARKTLFKEKKMRRQSAPAYVNQNVSALQSSLSYPRAYGRFRDGLINPGEIGSQITHKRSNSSGKLRRKMMHLLDTRDPNIQRVWGQINDIKDGKNWMLMGASRDQHTLKLEGSGSGGLREFVGCLSPERVLWGIVKVQSTTQNAKQSRRSMVFFTHVGEKVGAFARAKAAVRTPSVMRAFNNIALHLQNSDEYGIQHVSRELLKNSSIDTDEFHFGPEQSVRVADLADRRCSTVSEPGPSTMVKKSSKRVSSDATR
eukprot:CAMPEP_0184499778 /NCGR_PEP_ID=MMETSP0113_2-20130426/42489_1 /TAXON_ID=91329 /ORGANISM="Norrisiella sphaerica, Strain BC52" /LENGTH=1223 /DNA_ID=CAMNT_0026887825 /DNA_START=42 /DNA_END=3710 /DNA_ORIENTATION=+